MKNLELVKNRIEKEQFLSQGFIYNSPAFVTFVHGNRGGGKTRAIIQSFIKNVGVGYGSNYTGYLFREEYKDLENVKEECRKMFIEENIFDDQNFCKFNKKESRWTFKTGEKFYLQHAKDMDSYSSYHGHSIQFLAFDEITRYKDLRFKQAMRTCVRSTIDTMPLRVIEACNPYGPSHNKIKKEYIDQAPDGEIYYKGKKSHVNIHSNLCENKYLMRDSNYIDTLHSSCSNVQMLKAWLLGSWDITSGGIIDDVWNRQIHTITDSFSRNLKIPNEWPIYCVLDWGSSKPYAVLFVRVLLDNVNKRLIKNDILIEEEIYGCVTNMADTGLQESPREVENKILDLIHQKKYKFNTIHFIADSQIFQNDGRGSIADEFKKIIWEPAVKGPNSRVNGLEILRQKLKNSIPVKKYREYPGLFVVDRCSHFIATVPTLPRCDKNPDDCDSNAEDHLYDCIRYFLQREKNQGIKIMEF